MRYAITYTTDREWNSVDTFIVETDTSPLNMTKEQLTKMFEAYIGDGVVSENLATDYKDNWFIRNLEDTDINMVGQ